MKRFILSAIMILANSSALAGNTNYPELFFSYSFLYDSVCSETPGKTIKAEWADEARAKTKEFDAIWKTQAPSLMGKLFELFNKDFQRKELTATLSVCPRTPSFSNPLTINALPFLKSYMGEKPTLEDYKFVDLVFHELIHSWVVENLKWPSDLITKYQNEERTVKNHLHLMAVQQYVYTELKRTDMLDWLPRVYGRSPDYKRAWEIVQAEGYQPFVEELKK